MHPLSGQFYILYCLAIALCRWVYQNNSTDRKVCILYAALTLVNALFLRGLNMSKKCWRFFYVLKLIACDLANDAPETKNCINPVPQIVQISSFNKIPIVCFLQQNRFAGHNERTNSRSISKDRLLLPFCILKPWTKRKWLA